MKNLFPGCAIRDVEFCPFEDVLGVGHCKGFTSLVIPGKYQQEISAKHLQSSRDRLYKTPNHFFNHCFVVK